MQTTIDLSEVITYAFELAHHSDGWITPFGRAVAEVPYEAAVWKPGHNTASIAELTVHAFNYLNKLDRDLGGEASDSFEDWPNGSFSRPEWDGLKEQVRTVEASVRARLQTLTPERLEKPDGRGSEPLYATILDIAIHDAYHSGQVVKMMQLWSDR